MAGLFALLSANESRKLVKDLMQWPDSVKTVFGVPKPGDSNGEKLLTVIKVIASKIPYVGAAIGVLDFLSNGGDELASPSQVGPVTFNVNLQLDGNITENSAPLTTDFYTPGSPAQSKTQFKPTYNNILGVFNVLELPEMEYAEIIPRNITNTSYDILKNYSNNMFEEDNDCEKGYRDFHGLDGAANVKFRQYRPKSNLKYVLNPASNLEVESIEASFVLEYDKSQNLFIQRPDEFSSSVAFPFHEIASTPEENNKLYHWGVQTNSGFYIGSQLISYDLNGRQVNLTKVFDTTNMKTSTFHRYESIRNSSNLDLEFVSAKYPIDDSTFIRFRTNYVPITCFQEANFILLGTSKLPKLYCKVYVRLKRKDKLASDPVTMIITFDMSSKLLNAELNTNYIGQYDCAVRGNSYQRKLNCCYKCGIKFNFRSAEIWDYNYIGNFKIVNVPFSPTLYSPLHSIYNGEQNLSVRGTLIIPDNSIIQNNSTLKAAGKITIGSNVTFGNNIKIISGTKILAKKPPLRITSGVKLLIAPLTDIWFNCTNGNYTSLQMSESEISSFCKSKNQYIEKVYLSTPIEGKKDTSSKSLKVNDIIIVPNPTTGLITIVLGKIQESQFDVSVLDISGRLILSKQFNIGINENFDLDLSQYPEGIYFIITKHTNGSFTQKIILSK
jgi:hypothetical protein